jgi:hypothetical protein
MSTLKQFTEKVENDSFGEIIPAIKDEESTYTSAGYIKLDGSVVLQSGNETLYQNIGLIQDNLSISANIISSNTTNNIVDLVYGNNEFVYVDSESYIGKSSDASNWIKSDPPVNLSYVGGKTFSRAGTTSTTSVSLTDLTGGLDSAPATGDVVFVAVATGSEANRSQAVTGYTQVASLYVGFSVEDTNLFVGYRLMDATPNTSVTIPSTGSVNDAQTVAIQVWRNVDPNIFDVTTTTATQTNTVLVNPPAITTVSNNTVLLVIGAGAHTDGVDTYTASYLSNFLTVGSNDDNDSTIGFGSISRPESGTYDPAAWTFSGTNNTDYSYASVTIALKPKKIKKIFFANNIYFSGGTYFASSTNGTTWSTIPTVSGTDFVELNAFTYSSNSTYQYITGGVGGNLYVSTNANTWITATSNTNEDIIGLAYGNNTFVSLTATGNVFTTGDANGSGPWIYRSTIGPFDALSYVGGKTFSRVGTTSTTSVSLTDLTGGLSSAPAANDIVFVAVATGSNTIRSQAVTGYTQVASLYADDTLDTNLFVGYKLMTATPDTTVTIPSTGSTDDAQTVAIQVWRNYHPNIFDVTATTATQANTVLVNPPAITTVSINTVLLVIGAGGHVQSSRTYTASYLSNFLTVGDNDTYDSTIGFGSISRPDVGTYDPAAWTFSSTDSTNHSCASVTIALKPLQPFVFKSLEFVKSAFISTTSNGSIYTSNTNGASWAPRTSGTTQSINATTSFDSGLILYGGAAGVFASSLDTSVWTSRTSSTSNNINALAYGNGISVFVGDLGTIGAYEPYTYNYKTEFILPTLAVSQNTFFDLYIKT